MTPGDQPIEHLYSPRVYKEGKHVISETPEGEVISVNDIDSLRAMPNNKGSDLRNRQTGNVFAYQIDDVVVWENEEGEVIKRFSIPKNERSRDATSERMKLWFRGHTDQSTNNANSSVTVNNGQSSNDNVNHRVDSRDDETPVERKRREAALGIYPMIQHEVHNDTVDNNGQLQPELRVPTVTFMEASSMERGQSSSRPVSPSDTHHSRKSSLTWSTDIKK